jgi:PRTRC genetic system protein B
VPEAAIVIYRGGDVVAATRHPVSPKGVIGVGEPIDVAGMQALLAGKPDEVQVTTSVSGFRWQTVNVIAESAAATVWWTAPGRRTVFIAGKPAKVWFPLLVWCGHRHKSVLYCWAARGSTAPTPRTVVYRPRFGPDDGMNHIFEDSAVCIGSMDRGRGTPADWTTAFFDSNFKTNGNLPYQPYAPEKRFKKIGPLASALASLTRMARE